MDNLFSGIRKFIYKLTSGMRYFKSRTLASMKDGRKRKTFYFWRESFEQFNLVCNRDRKRKTNNMQKEENFILIIKFYNPEIKK